MTTLPPISTDTSKLRRTSSPLSSPSSLGGLDVPRENAPSLHNGTVGSPATSSTLPLTDDESELTEEEDVVDTDTAEEGNVAEVRDGARQTGDNRQSQTSTASLTPPSSDPVSGSPGAESPKPPEHIALMNGNSKEDTRPRHDEEELRDDDGVRNDEQVEDEEDDQVEDADLTMRPIDNIESGDENQEDREAITGAVGKDCRFEESQIHIENDGMDIDVEMTLITDNGETEQADEEPVNGAFCSALSTSWPKLTPCIKDHGSQPITVNNGKNHLHAPLPPPAALRELLLLEVKLAELRNCLYVERMEEAAEEEEMVLKGTYPALQHLYKTLEERRERLHEGALRRFQAQKAELKRMRDSETHLIWSTWTDERDRLHWEEFQRTWSQRRKLAREKGLIDAARR
nr:hypothetical protein L203_01767 [Cryptococcus depauperatus CBS 7841]